MIWRETGGGDSPGFSFMENANNKIAFCVRDLIDRILSPVQRFSNRASITCSGGRMWGAANMTTDGAGQMFFLADIPVDTTCEDGTAINISNIPKLVTALKAAKTERIELEYDGSGLDYRSKNVAFRIRLSNEAVSLPFSREKLLSLPIACSFGIPEEKMKGMFSLLSGFSNLNMSEIVRDGDSIMLRNTDRSGVTDESAELEIADGVSGEIPDGFLFSNYIFKMPGISSMRNMEVRIGSSFAMFVSSDVGEDFDHGTVRYIIPKLKHRQ